MSNGYVGRGTAATGNSPSAATSSELDSVGKHTLVEQLQVQRRSAREPGLGPTTADVHSAAAHGTSGSAGTLPHLDTIQRLFGHHDVSHVKAHTDVTAREGATAMGAKAFASNDHVAFAGTPDLHTTAHEAAHVVQQRAGVHLAGGVDQADDPYEQHADAVADRVVAGHSAEALLDGALSEDQQGEREEDEEASEDLEAPSLEAPSLEAPSLDRSSGGAAQRSSPAVQRARTKTSRRSSSKKKKKKKTDGPYAGLQFEAPGGITQVKRVLFYARPPSNSRTGQGDHVVAYALVQDAVARAVAKKPIGPAATALGALITDSKPFVKKGATNGWWHQGADWVANLLGSINPVNDATARSQIGQAVNETAKLLNLMPGSTVKNASSTGGHGEGGAHGGLQHLESTVVAGKTIDGNLWENVLGLIDLQANRALLTDETQLEHKLNWLMTLFKHSAPTVVELLKKKDHALIPHTDLSAAVNGKVGAGLTSMSVSATIETFLGI